MKILVIAPHADDETLGMGGTIAKYASQGHELTVAVLTGHGDESPHPLGPKKKWNIVRSEFKNACEILGVSNYIFEEIPAVMVPDIPVWKLNSVVDGIIKQVEPDVLYVPFLNDLHKDHREIFHACSVSFRPYTKTGKQIKEVYAYEVCSETHLNFPYVEQGFIPNIWVDISDFIEIKLKALKCYQSQLHPSPSIRSIEAVKALSIWRGSQINVPAAESFVLVRKID